ncbi:2Fe-2S iron-sulfur cluster-binding protein [Algicola sagamiensis]|uniref:2Fe-2S iron-sulfur cluster-binding protein n=1 Tax=Algicola sagamiensis TaxID=163869 RepID=UPI00036CC94F|nr:2Fe-2S iron-sulfur cluster binding domain-containing protein [Algicola sagamiensis]
MEKRHAAQIKVEFRNQEYFGELDTALSILENIERMKIPIRNSCRRGLCGACRIKLHQGQLDPDRTVEEEEHVYACASYLLEDDVHVFVYG